MKDITCTWPQRPELPVVTLRGMQVNTRCINLPGTRTLGRVDKLASPRFMMYRDGCSHFIIVLLQRVVQLVCDDLAQ